MKRFTNLSVLLVKDPCLPLLSVAPILVPVYTIVTPVVCFLHFNLVSIFRTLLFYFTFTQCYFIPKSRFIRGHIQRSFATTLVLHCVLPPLLLLLVFGLSSQSFPLQI